MAPTGALEPEEAGAGVGVGVTVTIVGPGTGVGVNVVDEEIPVVAAVLAISRVASVPHCNHV